MAEQLDISLVESRRCAIEICIRLENSESEILQLSIKPMETSCSFQEVEAL
jgi:hypothetical protein